METKSKFIEKKNPLSLYKSKNPKLEDLTRLYMTKSLVGTELKYLRIKERFHSNREVLFKDLKLTAFSRHLLLQILHFRCLRGSYKSSRQELFLRKEVRKICSKFIGEHPCRIVISRNCTSAWVFSCKFAGYFQNTVS